jgi:hypothetical protein
MKVLGTLTAFILSAGFALSAWAGEADVIDAKVRRSAPHTFDFDVTVKSIDNGAGYYADAIEVLAPDGKLLGRRELLHSHEDEQPFTRDVYGVRIPPRHRGRRRPRAPQRQGLRRQDADAQVADALVRAPTQPRRNTGLQTQRAVFLLRSRVRVCGPIRSIASRGVHRRGSSTSQATRRSTGGVRQ